MTSIPNFDGFQTLESQDKAFQYDNYSFPQMEEQTADNNEFINFNKSTDGKLVICLANTQKVLDLIEVELHYNVIRKRAVMECSSKSKFNGEITDYRAYEIMEYAVLRGYRITKNVMIDHLNTIARKNKVNPVGDYFDNCLLNWDGKSRIKDVYRTLNSSMDEKLGLAYFMKWCVQAVRLAFNTLDKKLNQEFVLVLKGPQGCGKTSWLKMLFEALLEYFKEGLELRPDNKDCVIECITHFVAELGELDGTMSKSEQASLKAFITRSDDEIRRPYERSSEKHPRTTVLCATVNEDEFLKDKTGNRRYATIPVGNRIDRLYHIDLDQFWGEITNLAKDLTFDHRLSEEEFKMQQQDNEQYEILNETELIVEESFHWGADKNKWKEMRTGEIASKLNLNSKSRLLGGALRKYGAKRIKIEQLDGTEKRGWFVPPLKNPLPFN